MKEKIAIVASGGGMSCSYSAGAINALANYCRFFDPDIVIGGSGSTGILTYYVSGQYWAITKIWGEYLSTKKFINKWRFWKLIDVDYLIDEIFGKHVRLNARAVMRSHIDLFIAATNYKTGELKYFSNKTMKDEEDIFDILRASKAMPIAFNKKIKIHGEKFCDSYLSSYPNAHIQKAIELGANNIILIDSRLGGGRNEAIFKVWLAAQSRAFKKNYNEQMREILDYKIPNNVNIITIKRSSAFKVGTFDSKKEDLAKVIQMGHDDVVNSKEIKTMLDRLR
ncbi:patatin-like phospholipase family protein [Patescibacteria group bacterium]|nr:patatin-like phospholipase family protein [Patescibacteria group bacterium]